MYCSADDTSDSLGLRADSDIISHDGLAQRLGQSITYWGVVQSAARLTLDQLIGVRIPAPQQAKNPLSWRVSLHFYSRRACPRSADSTALRFGCTTMSTMHHTFMRSMANT